MVPRGGVYGLLLLIIVLLSLSYLPATCPSMDSSRPRPWGATDPGPLFVSRCPWGTDWRGAPVMDPGRETFERLGQEHSRGRSAAPSLVRPCIREIKAGERKVEEPQAKDGNNFNKTSNEKEQANCGKQMKSRVRHLI